MSAYSSFSQNQYDIAYPENVEEHFWHLARNEILWTRIKHHISPRDFFMDVGCGRGLFVKFIQAKGHQIVGCDTSRPTNVSRSLNNLLILGSSITDVPHEIRHSVTFLLLLEVLEHIDRPHEFLTECLAAFPSVTKILITVPARQELYCHLDRLFGHIKRYSLADALTILHDIPTKSLESGYFFHMLYLPSLVIAKTGMKKKVKPPKRGDSKSVLFHKLLAKFFIAESQLIPRGIPGAQIYILATVR